MQRRCSQIINHNALPIRDGIHTLTHVAQTNTQYQSRVTALSMTRQKWDNTPTQLVSRYTVSNIDIEEQNSNYSRDSRQNHCLLCSTSSEGIASSLFRSRCTRRMSIIRVDRALTLSRDNHVQIYRALAYIMRMSIAY